MPYWESIRPSSTDDDSEPENFIAFNRGMLGQANQSVRFVPNTPVRMSENDIPLADIRNSHAEITREFDIIEEEEQKQEDRNFHVAVKIFEEHCPCCMTTCDDAKDLIVIAVGAVSVLALLGIIIWLSDWLGDLIDQVYDLKLKEIFQNLELELTRSQNNKN